MANVCNLLCAPAYSARKRCYHKLFTDTVLKNFKGWSWLGSPQPQLIGVHVRHGRNMVDLDPSTLLLLAVVKW